MASPQVENGYTKIATELLEAIMRYKCGGTQKDIIMCVIRYTYGYHRKQHTLGAGFIASAIGRNSRRVAQEIEKLIERNVLIEVKTYSENTARVLKLNKDYTKWVCAEPLTVSENAHTPMSENAHRPMSGTAHHDIIINKLNIPGKLSHRQKRDTANDKRYNKAADEIYQYYAEHVRAGARASAIKNIIKLFSAGETETTLKMYIDNYRRSGMPQDNQYRIQANNFFGKAARYQDFTQAGNKNGSGVPKSIADLPYLT